ncbi:ankyrin repeat domain-containing protein [Allochromatium palmeri]|uniref:Ankyrin repeat domain-containing protein n=2 Tax=Allochromatium palmeri TaxID=231048 RepID=A0A6N8E9D8_9GAMM|nr:ankyrin repeat domain-containing protein [Allochromatium palmeri]
MFRPMLVSLCLSVFLLVACSEPARPTVNLHRAVGIGDLDQVKRHVYWDTDLDQPNAQGDYPLHVAARQGSVNVTRALLEAGADPSVRDAAGATPLQVALLTGKTQVAKDIIAHGVPLEPNALLLELADAGISDRDSFELLLRQGAGLNRIGPDGDTALTLAIKRGHLETVARLILLGVDVNQPDAQGRQPLDVALEHAGGRRDDRTQIVERLQRLGALSANTH